MLDIYDDLSGSVLTRLLPDQKSVPDFIKQASPVTQDTPDEDFALIMFGPDGEKKRKYACSDPGNTALSVLYFMENKNLLTDEMRKVAAKNLVDACTRFRMEAPLVLEKQAGEDGGVVYFEEEYLPEIPELGDHQHKTASGIPLDTLNEVSEAVRYFGENCRGLHPRERRSLAIPIEKRASALGVEVPAELSRYAGDSYAHDLRAYIDIRENLTVDDEDMSGAYRELHKRASSMAPSEFAEALLMLDAASGLSQYWDSYVPDPYYSTFNKVAEAEFEHSDGVDKVTGSDLQALARNKRKLLLDYFPNNMVDGFIENPIVIFKSLPQPQKKIIMRLAQDGNFPGGETS